MAYIDPGAGNLLVQTVISGVVTGVYLFKLHGPKLKLGFQKLEDKLKRGIIRALAKHPPSSSPDAAVSSFAAKTLFRDQQPLFLERPHWLQSLSQTFLRAGINFNIWMAPDKRFTNYLPQFDALRGLAALCVVVAHFNPAPLVVRQESGLGILLLAFQSLSLGNLAVVFFFTLSAFLLTYLACNEFQSTGDFSVRQFIMRRVLRIWPLYFAVVATTYFIYSTYDYMPPEFAASVDTWRWLKEHFSLYIVFLSNWSLTFNYVGTHVDSSPSPMRILWSIGVEEQFYIVYPFLILIALRFVRARLWIGGLTLLAAWSFRAWFCTLDVTNRGLQSAGGMYYATLSYADVLLAGAIAGWIASRPRLFSAYKRLARPWLGPVLLMACLAMGALWTPHLWYPYDSVSLLSYPLAGVLFALSLLWICARQDLVRFLIWRPLRALGDLSYGIYMWHVIANACLAHIFDAWVPHSTLFYSPWARLIGSVVGALAFATLSRFVLEKPFLHLKAHFRQHSAPLSASA